MITPANAPLYVDPAAWSAALALLAIALSQESRLRQVFQGRKLVVRTTDYCTLYHFLGNVQLNLFLGLRNTGGRDITISKIACTIHDGSQRKWFLPAQAYYSRQPTSQPRGSGTMFPEFPFTWIVLKPGESWNETVHCYSQWSEKEEEEVSGVTTAFRKDIYPKLPSPTLVDAEATTVQRAMQFFERKFGLDKGTYQLLIAVLSESEQPLAIRGFNFTLYESSIRDLRGGTEEYKWGGGIIYPHREPTNGVFNVRLTRDREMDSDKAKALFQELLRP